MTESELRALESRVHCYGFDGADPVDSLALIDEVRRLRGLLAEAWAWPDGDYSDAKAKRLYDEISERVKEALSPAPDCADVV